MSQLKLFLFGPPRLEREGQPIEIRRRKALALAAYLAVSGQPHSRDALGTLFWPEQDQSKARTNLRRDLSRLNKLLGAGRLTIDREKVSLNDEANLWLDVAHFQHSLITRQKHNHPANEACPDCLPLLKEAVALYTNDFLAGFTLKDSPAFDEWQFFETESLRHALAEALERLVWGYRAQGEIERAIPHARRWLALDPLQEAAHHQLMELYAGSGQRPAALRQYQECVRILAEELGASPQAETTALYDHLRQAPEPRRPIIADRFTIGQGEKNLLGQGSMGQVYRGTDSQTSLPVAIKVLKPEVSRNHPELVERFVREGEALRQLNHPNIVKMLAATEKGGQHYLIMEYVEGGSLRALLEEQGPLPIARVVAIALGLVDALTRAHQLNIIHRDLKPGNVLIAEDGTPRLADFGIARMADSPELTETGIVMGTVDYLSPEACNGENLDTRTDIWALGVLLYELLAGERPFRGENIAATLLAIVSQPVPDLIGQRPDTPPPLAGLICRMLAKDPQQRLSNVRLVGAELEAILQGREEEQRGNGEVTVSAPLPPFFSSASQPPHTITPFVARERELAELEATLETARGGEGQILFVIGGAGRGKTTLVQEFAQRAQVEISDLLVVSGYCNAHTGLGDPYLPFLEALTMLSGEVKAKWAGGLISHQWAQRLWEAMPITLPALIDYAPDLIDTFVPGKALLERAFSFVPAEAPWFTTLRAIMSDEDRASLEQKRIFAQYTALLKAVAGRHPLLLIVEDLHWIDASSTALLFHLSREVGDSRILIVGTYRPEEVALGWGDEQHPLSGIISELKRQHGDIWLDLGKQASLEGRQFVDAYLDSQPNRLEAAFREALFRQTGGHALFTVELLREMQARGDLSQDEEGQWVVTQAIDWQTLPAKVEGVIEKRIERLEEGLQEVLSIASIEGETFTAEVVARVRQADERGLIRQLSRELDKQHRLVSAQAFERLEPGGQRLSLYHFRHQLFQHYLYYRLDETERAYLHEEVGTALEFLYGDQTASVAVQLAHHFEQAGLIDKAVTYLHQAGKKANRLFANDEAIAHFNHGLELLMTLPESVERNQRELDLQIVLGPALMAIRGYSAPEVRSVYDRALALCQQMGQTAEIFPVLRGLWRYYNAQMEHRKAVEAAERMLFLAQAMQDSPGELEAYRTLGQSWSQLGEFPLAQSYYEQAIALYDPEQDRSHTLLYGNDPGVVAQTALGQTLWRLGFPDEALTWSQKGLALAQELAHPFSLAMALFQVSQVLQYRRDAQATQELAEAAITLSTKHGFPRWLGGGTVLRGWALAEQGQEKEGVAQIRQGLSVWRDTGVESRTEWWLALLAEAYVKVDQVEEALIVVTEALELVEKSETHKHEADLYRLKGELLLMQNTSGIETDAEACFQQAITIAQKQQARSCELRATVSLCRLWRGQGKAAEAQQMLAKIYNWFSEGFDTSDLIEAKALLEELS